ncbi:MULTISPECIES: chemotaxis protein CheA [Methylomonas]|uniref:Chemotaxis protein CheA n=2 Tax=Methylomonas TaxID=416 RepID=A0A126T3B2_9GAMM|nr:MULTISPECIES: chemotaxis protein CheA [Methylomonas]AMK76559.1 chemotaxis protein CheA [Methylomonas denitrificans]OAI08113.1 chemotaxis protein CheA [Methylomonas methanica]TCV88602.1 two-component system chemotaxis sensor kinase CheA [Methylomonas methanica]
MSFDEQMRDALKTFVIESLELLQDMEDGLLGLEIDPEPSERINAIFRAAHTIKGSAGLFGLDHIVAFTHVVESVLDTLRDGKLNVSPELVAALLPCCDHMIELIQGVSDGHADANSSLSAAARQLLDGLESFLNPEPKQAMTAVQDTSERLESSGGGIVDSGNWHLFIQFGENCLRDGMDPLSFIRYLATLGEIVSLTTFSHAMPDADSMDPETSYLGFEIVLNSDADKATIESVFDFVREGSYIHILPLENRIPYYVELIESLGEENAQLGELLLKSGVITQRELQEGLNAQQAQIPQPSARIGEILVDQQVVQQPLVNAALEKQQQIKDNKARENQSIRVDAERLDKLIDLIGELVISSAAASLRGMQSADVVLQEANASVISLVEEVRDSALQLRMVPIGTTFNRFQRVVRDISKELGKDIKLVIGGADTEVDKSVVEKIGDPLMHLVRNAMDHGIERAEQRLENGKPAQGTLSLNAYHSSGNIVIEVSDDGGGLNRDKILAKAIERGLVQAGAALSDQEIFALIFEPGFSTADQISNLSGRGVGMDVVKRNIAELRGVIDIDSVPGRGTTLKIQLPLTLAIIDGFLAGVGDASYVIPLDRVVECVELPVDDHRDYMELRGEVLPFIRLRQLFRKTGPTAKRQNVIVVEHLGFKAGLVVDRLLGELQTVIKPLGKLFSHVQGVGGSTILGSGEVALIIDVPTLIRQQEHNPFPG